MMPHTELLAQKKIAVGKIACKLVLFSGFFVQ
jgi:hypothetical protein